MNLMNFDSNASERIFEPARYGTKRDTGQNIAFLEQPKEWVSRLRDVNILATSRGSDIENVYRADEISLVRQNPFTPSV